MSNISDVKKAVAVRTLRPMSPAVAEVRTNINLMVEVMKSCMVNNMHYGVIPGVQKPSLFKAGAEKIMATFSLSANPVVEDLSENGEIRFRVRVEINAKDGRFVGAGVGECSSQEEKYMWRVAVCQEEFEVTPEDKRRIKFKKNYNGPVDKIQQIRCNPSDLANTILKMAKKRALVDGVLTATGASDLFSQDIEDLPAEYVEVIAKVTPEAPKSAPVAPPVAQTAPEPVNEPSDQESPVKGKLSAIPVGSTMLDCKFMVKGMKTRQVKGKDGMKDITAYQVEDASGDEYSIERWGGPHAGTVEGSLVTMFEIKVKEYQGNRQYMAGNIVLDA
jgi:hypothetical protein